ncbi:hypothetical protein LINPERHAP2_LOCUS33996 [Linum perenne]
MMLGTIFSTSYLCVMQPIQASCHPNGGTFGPISLLLSLMKALVMR